MRAITWVWVTLLLLTVSCIDTIELDLPVTSVGRVVVEGSVYRSPDYYVFRAAARRTVQIIDDLVFETDDASLAILFNDEEILSLQHDEEVRISINQFHQDFGGSPENANFRLRVITSDGRTLESDDQSILDPPSRTTTLETRLINRLVANEQEFISEQDFVELLINSPLINDKGERLSYLWEVSGVYRFPEIAWSDDPLWFGKTCYVPVDPRLNQVSVVSNADLNVDQLSQYKIEERLADSKFHAGFYYTVVLKAIDVSAAEYWKEVAASITREGTLFDTPPGMIRTNFRNVNDGSDQQVLGYFYAAGIDTVRHLATPEATGYQKHLCRPTNAAEVPCCSCLEGFRNASIVKPPYWK